MLIHRINWKACFQIFVVLGLGPFVYAQGAEPQSQPAQSNALNRLSDSRLPLPDRLAAYQEILNEPAPQRQESLLKVVQEAEDEFSATASRELLRNDYPTVEVATFVDQLERRGAKYKEIVLNSCLLASEKPNSRGLARQFLARVLSKKETPDKDNCDAVGSACLVLAAIAEPGASQLILKAIPICPQSRRLWLAAALAKSCSESETELARRIWQDKALDESLRMACAAAIAPHDKDAESFVKTEVEKYLNDFAGDERLGLQSPITMKDGERYKEFRERIRILSAVRFMEGETAKDLALKCALAKNYIIRNIGLLALCIRWPEDFLTKSGNNELVLDQDSTRFLAALLQYHPDMETQVNAVAANRESLDKTLAAIRKGSLIGIFGMAGSVVLGI